MEIISLCIAGTIGLLITEMICYQRLMGRVHPEKPGPRGGRRVPAGHRAALPPGWAVTVR